MRRRREAHQRPSRPISAPSSTAAPLFAGRHHQKIQIIVPARSYLPDNPSLVPAVAYCGGMDVFNDRIGAERAARRPLQDPRPGSRRPGQGVLIRWNDHPDRTVALTDRTSTASGGGNSSRSAARTPRSSHPDVLAGRQPLPAGGQPGASRLRRADGRRHAGQRAHQLDGFYDTTKGVQQIWRAVKKAIAEGEELHLPRRPVPDQQVGG